MAQQITLLRVQRLDRGRTLFDLSVPTGISPGRLVAIEEGWIRPTAEEVRLLADALRIPIESLLAPATTDVALVPLRPERPTNGRRSPM